MITTTAYSEEEAEALVSAFQAGTLTAAAWTHPAHLVVAAWYVHRHPLQEAEDLVRTGIHRYLDGIGKVTTDDDGYHETVTRFWLVLVHDHLAAHPGQDVLKATNALIASPEGLRDHTYAYYSPELLWSREARYGWVPPDRKPLTTPWD